MSETTKRHINYDVLNLIGYGLAKFNDDFVHQFGFNTKTAFYKYCVEVGIADTIGTIKNRMDLFDPFFPENGRKGWWQKGDAYIHRKRFIDSLFANESVEEFANIVKAKFHEMFPALVPIQSAKLTPIAESRFRQLQKTGLQAELYFLANFNSIEIFENGVIEDARLYGDGYDFQVDLARSVLLAEVKGIRANRGKLRLTEKEYTKAKEYKDDYVLTVVLNLDDIPYFKVFPHPTKSLEFEKKSVSNRTQVEYHVVDYI